MRAKKELQNGLYHAWPPKYKAVMVDPTYNGFRVVYFKKPSSEKYGDGPYGIMDSIELKSMVDGKTYTSKAKYYEALKASDSHIIEAGEHSGKSREITGDYNCRKELKQAIERHLH